MSLWRAQTQRCTASIAALAIVAISVLLMAAKRADLCNWSIARNSFAVPRALFALGLVDGTSLVDDRTLLSLAIRRCALGDVQFLLERGADPSPREHNRIVTEMVFLEDGQGPASCTSDVRVRLWEELTRAGLDLRKPSIEDPVLAGLNSPSTIRTLLKYGARTDDLHKGEHGYNAEVMSSAESLRMLLEHGFNPKVPDGPTGVTPLFIVAARNYEKGEPRPPERLDAAKLLLSHGADVNALVAESAQDPSAQTPLDAALIHGDEEMAALLRAHGGKTHFVTSDGNVAEIREGIHLRAEAEDLQSFSRVSPAGCRVRVVEADHTYAAEGDSWLFKKGTTARVHLNCSRRGFFHMAVLGVGTPVPERLNIMAMNGQGVVEPIVFDQAWTNARVLWYFSAKAVNDDLGGALRAGRARAIAENRVTVGEMANP